MTTCYPQADDTIGPQVISCSRSFDFTLLFEQIVLSSIPSAIFLFVSAARISALCRRSGKTRSGAGGFNKITKQLLIYSFVLVQITLTILWASPANVPTRASLPVAVLGIVVGLVLSALSFLEHSKSVRPSAIITLYLLFATLLDVAQVRTLWLRNSNDRVAAVFTLGVVLKTALLSIEVAEKRKILSVPYSQLPPESLGGILNTTVFWWVNPLLVDGASKQLHISDLFDLDEKHKSNQLKSRIRHTWSASNQRSPHALLLAVLKCFWFEVITIVFFRLCFIAFEFCQPLLIHKTISLLSEGNSTEKTDKGRALVGATAIIYSGIAVTTGLYRHKTYTFITMIRGSLIGLVFDTTLCLDSQAARDAVALTLMSTDIDRIAFGLEVFEYMWAGPIEIAIASYLLYHQIGAACIAPVLASFLAVALSGAMRNISTTSQKRWLDSVKYRVVVSATALSNMKGIKMTGLSELISTALQGLRVSELDHSKTFRQVLTIATAISTLAKVSIPLITLITYVMTAKSKDTPVLTSEVAFTTLSLVALLVNPIQQFAKAVPEISAAVGCFQRVQEYICSCSAMQRKTFTGSGKISDVPTGRDDMELKTVPKRGLHGTGKSLMRLEDASFATEADSQPIIHGISLNIEPGDWVVVTGPVGCGKTMLLQALLGELHLLGGSVHKDAHLATAYCAQEPWLPNSSIQDVILAYDDFDEAWYSAVIDACSLRPDLNMFPARDQTRVGSNGINLSGGQRQRLSLARAVYSRKPFLILDDVLNGLDIRTERAIVEQVLGVDGLLKKHKISVVLATHSVNYAQLADQVIVMTEGGTIQEQGPVAQIALFEDFAAGPQPSPKPDSLISSSFHPIGAIDLSREDSRAPETGGDRPDLSRATGDIRLYIYYLKAIGWITSALLAVFICVFAVFLKLPTVWVSWWSSAEEETPGAHANMYAGIYGLFGAISLTSFTAAIFLAFMAAIPRSSIRLHGKLLNTVMGAPYWFLASTDDGQILNHFSQDMSLISLQLPVALVDTLYNTAVCTVGAVLITMSSKWALVILPALFAMLYLLQKLYLRTSRQMRLLDLEAKTPLYSHFLETLKGLTTIRAFSWQTQSTLKNTVLLDDSQKPFYLLYSIQRWLNFVLDMMVAGVATLIISLATQVKSTSTGAVGIALVNILTFSQDITALLRTWTELETSLGAVARIKNFESGTPSEHSIRERLEPAVEWPLHGTIAFKDLSSGYKDDAEPALRNVTLQLPAGSKVGVCGRTGSGKSTFLLTLLRLTEITNGDICIDGISIQSIPRDIVRRRIITIPQDPLILAGTVRFNADPFSEYSNDAILSVLSELGLLDMIVARGGLEANIDSIPLSRGEQQLFCLSRALLSSSKILVLDEVTSSVDSVTESKMMELVSRKFMDKTIVSVAHHLHTIRHFDYIVVLDQGQVAEVGPPDDLLARPSMFRELWEGHQPKQGLDSPNEALQLSSLQV